MLTKKGMEIIKYEDRAEIYLKNELVACGVCTANDLYRMMFRTIFASEVNIACKDNLKIWHERLGHINLKTLKGLSDRGIIENINPVESQGFHFRKHQSYHGNGILCRTALSKRYR